MVVPSFATIAAWVSPDAFSSTILALSSDMLALHLVAALASGFCLVKAFVR